MMTIEHASTPDARVKVPSTWRRKLKLIAYFVLALLGLAGLVVIGAHVVFGPGAHGIWKLDQALISTRLPSAVLRAVIGLGIFMLWPVLLRRRAAAGGWSSDRLASTVKRDRLFIGAAVVFDLLVLNLPLWLTFLRG